MPNSTIEIVKSMSTGISFEEVKTFAAFGGFVIASINLGYNIWRDYPRKAKLVIKIKQAQIRCPEIGKFDYEIVCNLRPQNKDAHIDEIRLKAPDSCFGPWGTSTREIVFNKCFDSLGYEIMETSTGEFKTACDRQNWNTASNLKIDQDSSRTITFAGQFKTTRAPDGYDQLTLKRWCLEVETLNGVFKTNFNFIRHHSDRNSGEFRAC